MTAEVRDEVMRLDGRCVAPLVDPEAGPCYDQWGEPLVARGTEGLEADYVRHGAHGPRHALARDHVAVCPGHHRGTGPQGGRQWATAHRADLREYLERRG